MKQEILNKMSYEDVLKIVSKGGDETLEEYMEGGWLDTFGSGKLCNFKFPNGGEIVIVSNEEREFDDEEEYKAIFIDEDGKEDDFTLMF